MRAVVYDAYRATPVLRDVEPPDCPEDGVVVDVRATGVCRSDWHAWTGHDPVPLPMVPGHELAGVIASVGRQVRRWSVGDRVTAPFVLGCGRCGWCEAGEQQVCPDQRQPGFTYPGSWAEQVALPAADANLVLLPDSVDFVAGAALGCRFATSFRALFTHGAVGPGEVVAVHGCGGAGLSAVVIAKALGAVVVAVELSAEGRALAGSLGADVVVDPGEVGDVATYVQAEVGGAHVSLDAVGSPVTAAASVSCLRRRGRHVQVGLLIGDNAHPPLPMDVVVAHELSIHGSHGMPAGDYPTMLAMISAGSLDPRPLVQRVVGLEDGPSELITLDDPAAARGITVLQLPPR